MLSKLTSPRFEIPELEYIELSNYMSHILAETKDIQHKRAIGAMVKFMDKLYTKCSLMQGIIDFNENKDNQSQAA